MPPRKRSGLGKGLDALIPQTEKPIPQISAESSAGVLQIPVKAITSNPRQPRANFDPIELAELSASIREHGVIQPLIVTKGEQLDQFVLIAGERRLLASIEAGLESVPAILRESNDQERLELALIENVQRADLSALETAEAYRQLSDEFGLSHAEIAKQVGKSRVAVTNTLRLLNLPPSVLEALAKGKISEGHARALLALPTAQSQAAALKTIIDKALNVRQTEELVRNLSGEKSPAPPKAEPVPEIKALEERLRSSLGTKVSLKHGRKGGTITIHYYSNEELDSLLQRFANED
ncbi:MAG TPA: stage 0 sporulation protein J [Chloroflexi bacterium]|nr:stage 0 sporulation protein J [Chloroflexota bacterium]